MSCTLPGSIAAHVHKLMPYTLVLIQCWLSSVSNRDADRLVGTATILPPLNTVSDNTECLNLLVSGPPLLTPSPSKPTSPQWLHWSCQQCVQPDSALEEGGRKTPVRLSRWFGSVLWCVAGAIITRETLNAPMSREIWLRDASSAKIREDIWRLGTV